MENNLPKFWRDFSKSIAVINYRQILNHNLQVGRRHSRAINHFLLFTITMLKKKSCRHERIQNIISLIFLSCYFSILIVSIILTIAIVVEKENFF